MRAWFVALCVCGCTLTADTQPAAATVKRVPNEKRYRLQKGDKEWLGYRAAGDPSSFVTCGLTPLPIENGSLKETEERCPERSRPFKLAELRVLKIRKVQGGEVVFEEFSEPAQGETGPSVAVIKDLTLELQSGTWMATKTQEGKTTHDSPWGVTDEQDPQTQKWRNLKVGERVVFTYRESPAGGTPTIKIITTSKAPQ